MDCYFFVIPQGGLIIGMLLFVIHQGGLIKGMLLFCHSSRWSY